VFFLGNLLFVYAYLPENVSLYSDEFCTPIYFISKSQFFYYAFALALIVNLLLFVFSRVLEGAAVTDGRGIFPSHSFKDKTMVWFEGLISVINIFLSLGAAFIGVYNNQVDLDFNNFTYLVYLGVFLICAWILSYGFVLRYRTYQPS